MHAKDSMIVVSVLHHTILSVAFIPPLAIVVVWITRTWDTLKPVAPSIGNFDCVLEASFPFCHWTFFIITYPFKVREGRRPEKATDAENFEANIAEVLLMVQVSCGLTFLGGIF